MTAPPPPRGLLESRLAGGIAAARWFAGKGRRIDGVTIHDATPLPGTDALLALVDVATADGGQRYAAVPATASAATTGVDHAGDLARWLAATVAAPTGLAGERGRFVVHAIPPSPAPRGMAAASAVVPLGGDASNSSFVVRDPSMPLAVKLVRRCRPGIQPEVEVGRFFATASPWHETPRLRGWLEYVPHGPDGAAAGEDDAAATVIATVHDFVPDCTTAWESLLGLLVAHGSAEALDRIVPIAAAIGRTTARMHAALAARPDIPAFAPRPATEAGRRRLAAALAAHAEEVFARVGPEADRRAEPLATGLRTLASARGRFSARFDRLGRAAADAGADIRVHGDYHLGQVLLGAGPDGVLVIDFEGEPGRSLDERRAPTSAAKDVAGMCRSFDYLLRQAAKGGGPAYDARGLARLEGSFLEAYREAAGDAPWWPAADTDDLLEAYRLDKALYELAYEIDNRPDWVDVPLAALLAGC